MGIVKDSHPSPGRPVILHNQYKKIQKHFVQNYLLTFGENLL